MSSKFEAELSPKTDVHVNISGAKDESIEAFGSGNSELTRQKLTQVVWAELFNGTVPPLGQIARPVANKDYCGTLAQPKDMKDSLASTALGDSPLHRIFEVAVAAPQGKVDASNMDAAFGVDASSKLKKFGVIEINRTKDHISAELSNPIVMKDGSSSISIAKTVSFDSKAGTNTVDISQISGVKGSNGWFTGNITDATLKPRVGGYMSGDAQASLASFIPQFLGQTVSMCAFPDGKIYR